MKRTLILSAVFIASALLCWLGDSMKAQTIGYVNGTNYVIVINTNLAVAAGITNATYTNKSDADFTLLVRTTNSFVTVSNTVTVTPTAGTNQVSFCNNSTNLTASTTNLSAAGMVMWVCTNTAFNVAGGSGLLQNILIRNSTNQDFVVWVFNRVITAPTVGSTWAPSQADLQYLAGKWDTTNTMWRAHQLAGTNYVLHLDRLSTPIKNTDSSVNLHLIATSVDVTPFKSNYVNTATYVNVGFINDK